MGSIRDIFTPDAEAEIRAAVELAERETSGEIVPFVVAASDSYEGALWKGAAFGALFGSLLAAAATVLAEPWWPPLVFWVVAPPVVGASVGFLLAGAAPPLRRALIGKEVMARRVGRRATVAFLEEEVFRTEERTGILIFLSLFERRVVVLGDEGINRKVRREEWLGLTEDLAADVRSGEAVPGLLAAIRRCGALLRRRGVELRPVDENELADDLRTRER
jgi:putative membrane protein